MFFKCVLEEVFCHLFFFFAASNFFHKLLFPLFLGKMSVCARANIADMANKKVIACNRDIIFTVRVI